MSLYRSMGRGSWIVKRTILGVHVRQATGIYDWTQAMEFERTLLKLGQHGRRDLIVAFNEGRVKGAELQASVEQFGINYQITVETAVKARRAAYEWLRDVKLADKTRSEYRHCFAAILGPLPPLSRSPTDVEERGLARGPGIADLPRLLARYARRAKPMMFVQVKAASQSLVRDTVHKGQHSELWHLIASIRGPKRNRRQVLLGLSPERAREVAEKLGQLGSMWWTICCTGMETKEYWRKGGFEVRDDRILIHGTKKETRDRIVFRLTTPVRPLRGVKVFRRELHAVGLAMGLSKLTPYVGRRTFAHFLELARILDSRCDAYMGHSPKGDRGKYREHDVVPYLAADVEAVRAVVGADPKYMRALA